MADSRISSNDMPAARRRFSRPTAGVTLVLSASRCFFATPDSKAQARLITGIRSSSAAIRRSQTSIRSDIVMRGHGPESKALLAAPTARSASTSPASGTDTRTCSVVGDITSRVALVAGSTQDEPM